MTLHPLSADRATRYATIGACIGLLAPLGWVVLRLLLFKYDSSNPFEAVTSGTYTPAEQLALTLYIGLGTAAVFGIFGRHFGKSSQAMAERAHRLDQLNQTIAQQKAEFENRFNKLNENLKNFHLSNARIQSSIERGEVLNLAASALHAILGYDRVNILMVSADATQLEHVAGHGGEALNGETIVLPFDHRAGVLGKSIRENRCILVRDMSKEPDDYRLLPPCDQIARLRSRSFVLAPISIDGHAIGLIAADNKERGKVLDETDVDTIRLFSDQVASSLNRIRLVQGVEALINELHHTFGELSRYRGRFTDLVHSLKTGSEATTATIARIVESSEVVRTVIDDTGSATTEISAAIEEVNRNFEKLQSFMEQSIATITEIAATARQVDFNAATAYAQSETMRSNAESGAAAVRDAFSGLEGISLSVDTARNVIEELSLKGREINRIIDAINEINQKTNLLSLNAAIIAAQAGEHGRSFAVVAEQIRSLSRETEQSAGAIARLVREIQGSTELAVHHIGETRQMVDRDIVLGRSTENALQLILDSAAASMLMSSEIRKSTAEQVKGSQSVARSIEELGGMASHLGHASREQTQGIRRIVRSVIEVKRMSEEMVSVTVKQNEATRRIDQEIEQVRGMSEHIFEALTARQNESYRVIEQLEAVKRGAGK